MPESEVRSGTEAYLKHEVVALSAGGEYRGIDAHVNGEEGGRLAVPALECLLLRRHC